MDVWEVWLVAFGVAVSGVAAVFTWVQAHAAVATLKDAREARDEAQGAASESARLAGDANAAFKRQAEAQEEANRIKRAEMTPSDWSQPVRSSGDLWRVRNTSRRLLIVDEFDVQPEAAVRRVIIHTNHGDGRYEFGDSFELAVVTGMGVSAEKLTVKYHYENDTPGECRFYYIGL